jgi:hypothetical protein
MMKTALLAEVLAGDTKTPPQTGYCMRCGAELQIPGFIIDAARAFNHVLAGRRWPKHDLLTKRNLIACDACRTLVGHDLDAAVCAERRELREILTIAASGSTLSTDEVRWVHDHGGGEQLNAILRSQGKTSYRRHQEAQE